MSYKTFAAHKRLYYDSETNTWNHEAADVVGTMDEESPPSSLKGLEDRDESRGECDGGTENAGFPEEPPLSDPGSLSTDSDDTMNTADGELTYCMLNVIMEMSQLY